MEWSHGQDGRFNLCNYPLLQIIAVAVTFYSLLVQCYLKYFTWLWL